MQLLNRQWPFGLLALLPACGTAEDDPAASAQGSAIPPYASAEKGLVVTAPSSDPGRPMFHDFGTVSFGEVHEHVFPLENRDSEPVTILSTQGACTCTKVARIETVTAAGETILGKLDAEGEILTIPPGARADLAVEIDTSKTKPNQHKLAIMRVRTDSLASPFLTFELHVFGERPFRVTPTTILVGDVPSTHGGTATATIVTTDKGSGRQIAGLAAEPAHFEVRIDETVELTESVWRVHATVPPGMPFGRLAEEIVLATVAGDGSPGAPLEIGVEARVVEDVLVYPRLFSFGPVPAGEAGQVAGKLRALVPGSRVKVLSAKPEGDAAEHLLIEYEAVGADAAGRSAEWTIVMTVNGELEAGRFEGRVLLELDDSQTPTVVVPFVGHKL